MIADILLALGFLFVGVCIGWELHKAHLQRMLRKLEDRIQKNLMSGVVVPLAEWPTWNHDPNAFIGYYKDGKLVKRDDR